MSHQEQNRPPTHFSLLICNIGKTPTCPTVLSRPHSHFPHVSHQEQNRPHTHFFLLICNIGATHSAKAERGASRSIKLGVALCFSRRRSFIPATVRRKAGFANELNKNCNWCAKEGCFAHGLHLVAFVKISHNLTISQLIMNKLSYGLSFAIYTIEFAGAEVLKAVSARAKAGIASGSGFRTESLI